VKSTWRLSPEVLAKTRVHAASEALEQQVVVEIALRKFLGMRPLSKEQMREARGRETWEALKRARRLSDSEQVA